MKPKGHKNRPLNRFSWSALDTVEKSPSQWYKTYVEGDRFKGNAATRFGKSVHAQIENGIIDVPRGKNPEKKFTAKIPVPDKLVEKWGYKHVEVMGFIDDYDDEYIYEYKTCRKHWTREQAESHGQLPTYAFLIWKSENKLIKKGKVISIETAYDQDIEQLYLTGDKVVHNVEMSLMDIMHIQARFVRGYEKALTYFENKSQPTQSIK